MACVDVDGEPNGHYCADAAVPSGALAVMTCERTCRKHQRIVPPARLTLISKCSLYSKSTYDEDELALLEKKIVSSTVYFLKSYKLYSQLLYNILHHNLLPQTYNHNSLNVCFLHQFIYNLAYNFSLWPLKHNFYSYIIISGRTYRNFVNIAFVA